MGMEMGMGMSGLWDGWESWGGTKSWEGCGSSYHGKSEGTAKGKRYKRGRWRWGGERARERLGVTNGGG